MGSEHGQTVITDLPGDRWLVSLEGEHDLSTAEDLSDKLRAIFRTGTTVVIDLSKTTFLDSSTLGVLVQADQYAKEHDCEHFGVVIAEDTPPDRLFALVGINGKFTTFASADEAFRHFEAAVGRTDAADSADGA
jgi:anti-sigma B factor antagonist